MIEMPHDIKTEIGETLGSASMCWEPRPSHQVFESTECLELYKKLEKSIMSNIPLAMAILTKALSEDPEYRQTWEANIAMAFYDACDQEGVKEVIETSNLLLNRMRVFDGKPALVDSALPFVANKAAKNFLDTLIQLQKNSQEIKQWEEAVKQVLPKVYQNDFIMDSEKETPKDQPIEEGQWVKSSDELPTKSDLYKIRIMVAGKFQYRERNFEPSDIQTMIWKEGNIEWLKK